MGLFSQTKVRRESSEEKAAASASTGLKVSDAAGSSSKVTGGGKRSRSSNSSRSAKKYNEDEFVSYIQRVGKVTTSPVVLRGIVSRQLKSTPNIQPDEMLRKVRRQLV